MSGVVVCVTIAAGLLALGLILDAWFRETDRDEWGRFAARVDDLRGDFDWPAGFPKVGDSMADALAVPLAVELFADLREMGIEA